MMRAKPGDKVCLKNNPPGERGVVDALKGASLIVRLKNTGIVVRLNPEDVINYSLAARKAWISMPDRAVGRKKGFRLCDRVSVTFRLDRDLWKRFQKSETDGAIEDRTETINAWLKEKLDALELQGKKV